LHIHELNSLTARSICQRVAFGVHSVKRVTENALFVDDESGAQDAVLRDTIHFSRLPDTVLFTRRALGIGQETHGNSMLVPKLRVFECSRHG
jgi:hypothetical protein